MTAAVLTVVAVVCGAVMLATIAALHLITHTIRTTAGHRHRRRTAPVWVDCTAAHSDLEESLMAAIARHPSGIPIGAVRRG